MRKPRSQRVRRPEAYAPAPLYPRFRKATRQWSASPLPLRREWSEHPSPRFFLALGVVLLGVFWGVFFAVGSLNHKDWRFSGGYSFAPGHVDVVSAVDFIGLPAGRVEKMLGDPAFARQEPPAVVWQYRTESCVLDLYVYEDAMLPRVHHAEIRARHPAQTAWDDKMARLGRSPTSDDLSALSHALDKLAPSSSRSLFSDDPEENCIRALRREASE